MRKMVVLFLVCLMLTGCGHSETFETIGDIHVVPVSASMRQIVLAIPEDASVMTMQSERGTIYLCDEYEICLETLEAGDMDRTIRQITGFYLKDLTVLKSGNDGFSRHDLVWSSAGEAGERLGRAAVLDDGSYHYVLSVLADADVAPELEAHWNQLFDSYGLG